MMGLYHILIIRNGNEVIKRINGKFNQL